MFFPMIYDSYCDMIHSFLTAVRKNISCGTGEKNYKNAWIGALSRDITAIILKRALNTIHSINQFIIANAMNSDEKEMARQKSNC